MLTTQATDSHTRTKNGANIEALTIYVSPAGLVSLPRLISIFTYNCNVHILWNPGLHICQGYFLVQHDIGVVWAIGLSSRLACGVRDCIYFSSGEDGTMEVIHPVCTVLLTTNFGTGSSLNTGFSCLLRLNTNKPPSNWVHCNGKSIP